MHLHCGLCHDLGYLEEYGESWPCPLCTKPEIEEEKELTNEVAPIKLAAE